MIAGLEHNDLIVGLLLAVNTILTGLVGWVGKKFVESVTTNLGNIERDQSEFKTKTHGRLSVLETKSGIYNPEIAT